MPRNAIFKTTSVVKDIYKTRIEKIYFNVRV